MKASELVVQLQALVEAHGDLEVGIFGTDDYNFCMISDVDFCARSTREHRVGQRYPEDECLGPFFIGID